MKRDSFNKLGDGITTRLHVAITTWIKEEVEQNKDLYADSTEEEINTLSYTLATNPPTPSTFVGTFNDAITELKKGGSRVGL